MVWFVVLKGIYIVRLDAKRRIILKNIYMFVFKKEQTAGHKTIQKYQWVSLLL